MIIINQGDTSDILILEDISQLDISSNDWEAILTIVDSEDQVRPLIVKKFSKDLENNIFFTLLLPNETIKLIPGRYIMGFQISNENLSYRKEIKDKLRVKKQVVWNKNNEEFNGTMPAFCIYTKDGSIPIERNIILN